MSPDQQAVPPAEKPIASMSLGELVLSMDADFRRRERDNDWLDEPIWVLEARRRAEQEKARRARRLAQRAAAKSPH